MTGCHRHDRPGVDYRAYLLASIALPQNADLNSAKSGSDSVEVNGTQQLLPVDYPASALLRNTLIVFTSESSSQFIAFRAYVYSKRLFFVEYLAKNVAKCLHPFVHRTVYIRRSLPGHTAQLPRCARIQNRPGIHGFRFEVQCSAD